MMERPELNSGDWIVPVLGNPHEVLHELGSPDNEWAYYYGFALGMIQGAINNPISTRTRVHPCVRELAQRMLAGSQRRWSISYFHDDPEEFWLCVSVEEQPCV